MLIQVLKSKIHRAQVTDIDLSYSGSIGIDADLMKMAGIAENEKVLIANLRNGRRLGTYAFCEKPGSRRICIYGPAVRLCRVGDRMVVMAFGLVEPKERVRPKIVIMGRGNRPLRVSK